MGQTLCLEDQVPQANPGLAPSFQHRGLQTKCQKGHGNAQEGSSPKPGLGSCGKLPGEGDFLAET